MLLLHYKSSKIHLKRTRVIHKLPKSIVHNTLKLTKYINKRNKIVHKVPKMINSVHIQIITKYLKKKKQNKYLKT